MPDRLFVERFPRASRYDPDWVVASASGGANALWLTEWLTETLELRPGLRVLDLGCGRAMSSVFLRRELGVEVWAVDLWISPSENLERIRDAGIEDGVFPLRANARALPFAAGFFDAVVAIDSFVYFGTDDLYLAELARFLKPEGVVAIAGAGLLRELDGPVPGHLQEWWEPSQFSCLHSAEWWRRHWERTSIVSVEHADVMADGWRFWLDWQREVAPGNTAEIAAVEADAGALLGYVRAVGRKRPDVRLDDPIAAIPDRYERHPLLREQRS